MPVLVREFGVKVPEIFRSNSGYLLVGKLISLSIFPVCTVYAVELIFVFSCP